MAGLKGPYEENGRLENITTVRGSRMWLVDSNKILEDRAVVIAVQARGKDYYFVEDVTTGEYCPVFCPAFIKEAERKLRRTHAKYLGVNNPALIQELIELAEDEDYDSQRVTNIVAGLVKILDSKGRIGVEK